MKKRLKAKLIQQMEVEVRPVFEHLSEHGEGPIYDSITDTIYWVDIFKGHVLSNSLVTARTTAKWEFKQPVGCLAITGKNDFLLAMKSGFATTKQNKVQRFFRTDMEYPQGNIRFNDGILGPDGSLYAGTMEMEGKSSVGQLFRLSSNGDYKILDEQLYIPNGMGWNSRRDTFFMIDTGAQKMYSYDYKRPGALLSNRRVHIDFPKGDLPDGMAMDTHGNFWIAMWGGSRIDVYDKRGEKFIEIQLPVPYPTSCCFVGENLDSLFVTTSRLPLGSGEIREFPLSGRCLLVSLKN